MYEDHGDTLAYQQDIYTEKKFVMEGRIDGMTLSQSDKGLYTPRYEYYRLRIIGLPSELTNITVDNKPVKDFTWNTETKELEFVVFKSFKKINIE
jgi:alpha-glucosidase